MEANLRDSYTKVSYHMEEREISSDYSGDNSPPSTTFSASLSSPKRRRTIQKEVLTFPLNEIQGSGVKGDCTPPSDSWAWRKYGQKPIKGSPYPRGYYRCSSSKGCPAKKQVERSCLDPNKLVVTYSYEHNHPWPISRNNTTKTAINEIKDNNTNTTKSQPKMENQQEPLINPTDEMTWLSSDHRILDENKSLFSSMSDLDMSKMREEDEYLFADLGELPECSLVFRRVGEDCSLAPPTTWCG